MQQTETPDGRLAVLFTKDISDKLKILCGYAGQGPYELIEEAIHTMYAAYEKVRGGAR